MYIGIKSVKPLDEYKLLLTFNNNLNKQLSGMVFEEYYLLLFIQS